MQRIDRDKFFESYRDSFGTMNQSQVDGINQLLSLLEGDDKVSDIRHAAYMMATVKHECGDEWHPIAEYGKGKGFKYGKADPVTGQTYYGRGYVQLTWKGNYAAMERVFGDSLLHHPDLAMQPDIAYKIMSYGMRQGAFTGVGLSRFIHGDVCDYVNSRKVINALDRAELIAGYATKLESALLAAV